MNIVLRDHFLGVTGTAAVPILPPTRAGSNRRLHKGGWTIHSRLRDVLLREMEDKHSDETWFTTMLDLYAIPKDFPALSSTPPLRAADRVVALEAAFRTDVVTDRLWRFTPYLQLHEFEALLLSDVGIIGRWMSDEASGGAAALAADIAGYAAEEVDGGALTAPSKRIIRHFPSYAGLKTSVGPIVAADIGLPRLRAACPHFDGWLATLESCCRG